jgi:hypothetical protein
MTFENDKSVFKAFTDIPKHIAYNLGSGSSILSLFNKDKNSDLSFPLLNAHEKQTIIKLVKTQETPFILKQPNCDITFAHLDESLSNQTALTYHNTIAKMTKITSNLNTEHEKTTTTISFEILTNMSHLPSTITIYNHVNITIDTFASNATLTPSKAEENAIKKIKKITKPNEYRASNGVWKNRKSEYTYYCEGRIFRSGIDIFSYLDQLNRVQNYNSDLIYDQYLSQQNPHATSL